MTLPLSLQERKLCCLGKIKAPALSALAEGSNMGKAGRCRKLRKVAAQLLVSRNNF